MRRRAGRAPPGRRPRPARPGRRRRDPGAGSKHRLHAGEERRGNAGGAPSGWIDAGERNVRPREDFVAAVDVLIGVHSRPAKLGERHCDVEPVGKLRRKAEIDFDMMHDEHDAMLALDRREVEPQRGEPFGARAFHELEIVRVIDDACRIGVLIIDADGKAKGFAGLHSEGKRSAAAPGVGGVSPKCRYDNAVATRPREVRWRKPCWIRNGSSTSSIVSRSSPIAAARLSMPTGPPANLSSTVRRSLRSITSSPERSTSSIASASRATA